MLIETKDIIGEIDTNAKNDEINITTKEIIRGVVLVIILVIVVTSLVIRVRNSIL
jgi:hypothetical protein